jgi:hypothetical protein
MSERSSIVLPFDVAVGKTPGEHAGSLVRVGSANGHLIARAQGVRCEAVVHGGSEVHLRKRAAHFLERLFPTATDASRSGAGPDRTPAGFWISSAPKAWDSGDRMLHPDRERKRRLPGA